MNPGSIAVMASGRGSNLAVILDAIEAGSCPVDLRLVISDRAGAEALTIARRAGVPEVVHISPKQYADRAAFDAACADAIEAAGCQWIVLAGYMRILSPSFVQRFAGRIINIHPALLPSFIGADGVGDALTYGVKLSGCTVHLVDEVLDGGPILAQAAVPVCDDDSRDSLHLRIQQAEHQLYPATLTRIVTTGFRLDGRRVIWLKP
ncbi:MAG: phosphoribosylglycinamide formyltransferase [Zetaproteobacteria bacterium CG12_big_fil_rev_8_21_14_0_65_54_13]|nr:MAG: phosphoribosylglycinamide formyltransferase [Zetaproteobacteria bacterium CG23_combo_of_CG06-09_8_20_14_all_54_7]PIW47676.1 MAG: phosphoribosylglycinamide formyltransferase [Zetaproteobacteria bacterium CG12_big_fil_rev_8_21_14_0_65_54_13]PIX54495.1 MAG: phosphoribosylglycinamide formyltransferase [Zetaproteobacteria bacterium CG_4_10_14_3_um_filter_54_28]PJA28667.1 MAG: phosphoribosylglycinamide formyltransferase [Zetaproteobacteria bacterium CG_4_9_14_3_um_filter_54_145]